MIKSITTMVLYEFSSFHKKRKYAASGLDRNYPFSGNLETVALAHSLPFSFP